jgi:hypothetical protein
MGEHGKPSGNLGRPDMRIVPVVQSLPVESVDMP